MRRSTDLDGNGGTTGAASHHTEQQTSSEHPSPSGDGAEAPSPNFDMAQLHLELLAGGDASHEFQTYYDPYRKDPSKGRMARRIYGRLSDVRSKLTELQQKGAAIAVTMAETNGRGRRSVNMLRPRAVWIEADGPLPRELPLPPSIVVETSPGKRHYIYVCRDLDWKVFHGVQQVLISEYGSDPRAGLRTQVLRLPGTLHQKDPAKPHLVRIVVELTSGRIYTAAEIAKAFPPKSNPPPRRVRQRRGSSAPGSWDPEEIRSAFVAIDARLKESGPFTAQGDGPDDQAYVIDWSLYDWWFRGTAAIHHASGGSDAGFELSCQVSGGDSSKGLIGCPEKFNETGQRRVWDSLSNDDSGLRGAPVTMDTIYWIARRYCGWNARRPGRPPAQPREIKVSERAEAVATAGRRAVSAGLDRVRELHASICAPLFRDGAVIGRVMAAIREGLNSHTGVVGISSLAGMANTLRCDTETVRRRIRELAQRGLIIKNDGNSASMFSTSGGITIALALPESVWNALNPQQSTPLRHIPHFPTRPG